MAETAARPLDPEKPYYSWSETPGDGALTIWSECCADTFSTDEEIVLRDYLLAKHPITPDPPGPAALVASPEGTP